ncbi:hypothetical protein BH11ACT2_BH11ACT2_07350 [soil metagenome]
MTNEPSWDEIFSSQPTGSAVPPTAGASTGDPTPAAGAPPLSRREAREQHAGHPSAPKSTFATVSGSDGRPPRKRRRLGWLWALLVIIVLIGAGSYAAWSLFEPQIRHVLGIDLPDDYTGAGNGVKTDVVVVSGDTGTSIAKTLVKAQVVMTLKSFYDVANVSPAPNFQPGTYALQKHMSAKSALAALLDPKNRVSSTVLIPEGKTLSQVLTVLADKTGTPLADFQAAAKDPTAYGVPATAPSLEGFLFPAKYQFDPGTTPKVILQTLVDRMTLALKQAGVAPADDLTVLTLASIVQKEGGVASDFPKVSRVFTNRLAQGIHLQSDATVSYGIGGKSIFTTAAQRADTSNKYNTYANPGLPIGPISAPGDAAIAAAISPAKGDWIYFVLVNGETGETQFDTTLAGHNAGVAKFQAWLKAHPDYKTGG